MAVLKPETLDIADDAVFGETLSRSMTQDGEVREHWDDGPLTISGASFHPSTKGYDAYLDATVKEGRSKGFVQTLFGRRRYLPELRSGNPNLRGFAERMATNAPIQGTAADLIKIAMIRLARALEAGRFATRMLLQVHDELLFEAPPDEEKRLEALAAEVMEGAMTLDVPLKVDVKVGADWAEV